LCAASGAEALYLGEDLASVAVRLDTLPDASDPTFLVYEVGRAEDAHIGAAVVALLAIRPVGRGDAGLWIEQEREVDVELLAEPPVAPCVVEAGSKDDRVESVELWQCVAEPARFCRSPGRVVLRIEVQDDVLFPSVVRKADGLTAVIRRREVGGRLSDL
jgi:hypothetical protein